MLAPIWLGCMTSRLNGIIPVFLKHVHMSDGVIILVKHSPKTFRNGPLVSFTGALSCSQASHAEVHDLFRTEKATMSKP